MGEEFTTTITHATHAIPDKENCKHKRMALLAGLLDPGTRLKATAEVVWILETRPQRGSHCIRVGVTVQVLVDALHLVRNVCHGMSGWSPQHFQEILVRYASSIL